MKQETNKSKFIKGNNKILIVSENKPLIQSLTDSLVELNDIINKDKNLQNNEIILIGKPFYVISSANSNDQAIRHLVNSSSKRQFPSVLIIDLNLYLNSLDKIVELFNISHHSELLLIYHNEADIFYLDKLNFSIKENIILLRSDFNSYVLNQIVFNQVKKWKLKQSFQSVKTKIRKKIISKTSGREKMHKQRIRFFVNLAHETKTPLTLIDNYLNKYIQKVGMNQDLSIIKANIDKLLRDMVNFLDAEKLKRGQIYYDHDQIIGFSDILCKKIVLFQEIASKKNILIESDIEDEIYIKADPYSIDRIINNLIDNAIKYTPDSGKIFINLKTTDNIILFSVKDTGIGMNDEQIRHLFKPFHQLSNSKRNIQGVGMGLYIVKKIIKTLFGSIVVYSEVGKGSEFNIILNKHFPTENDNIKQDLNLSKPFVKEHLARDIKETNILPNKSNILFVDDNIDLLYFIQSALSDKFNLFLATDGKDAILKLNKIPKPDMIISDIMMDEMNGHELFKKLSESDEYKDIPFIFLSAKTTSDEKIKGLYEGAIDYIYKPFLIDELTAKIESILRHKKTSKIKNLKEIEQLFLSTLRNIEEKPDQSNTQELIDFNQICKIHNISSREKDVLELLIQGFYNKEICEKLNISIKTVEFHIHNIYEKFSVSNKVELINLIKKKFNSTLT